MFHVKKIVLHAVVPKRATEGSAGLDLDWTLVHPLMQPFRLENGAPFPPAFPSWCQNTVMQELLREAG